MQFSEESTSKSATPGVPHNAQCTGGPRPVILRMALDTATMVLVCVKTCAGAQAGHGQEHWHRARVWT